MKKSGFFVVMLGMMLALGMVVTGCASAPVDVAVRTASLSSYEFGYDVNNYDVLDTIKASGKITVDSSKMPTVITGDTDCYGYFADIDTSLAIGNAYVAQTKGGLFGLGGGAVAAVTLPSSYAERAYHNAVYALIEQAKAKGADTVAFVNVDKNQTLENKGKVKIITVDVSATLLKKKAKAE